MSLFLGFVPVVFKSTGVWSLRPPIAWCGQTCVRVHAVVWIPGNRWQAQQSCVTHSTDGTVVNLSLCFNPRPAGVWLVTRPAGGGGAQSPPPLRSPKLPDRFLNFKRNSIALYVNYPYEVKHLTRRSLMTSQVRSKSEFSTFRVWCHRRVKFRC